MRPSKPNKAIGQECIRRIAALKDPAAIVLITHLFTEQWINQILLKHCPHSDLTDHGKAELTYSQKLHIVHSLGKIPDKLFQNLKKLNRLRHDLGSRIDFDFTKVDLQYHATRPAFALPVCKPSNDPDAQRQHIVKAVKCVLGETYVWLHDHCVNELGLARENLGAPASLPARALRSQIV